MDSCKTLINDVPGVPGRFYHARDLYPNQPDEALGGARDYYIGVDKGWSGAIALSGCVIFHYESSPNVHQRGFTFLLMKKGDADIPVEFLPFNKDLPIDQLVFVDYSGEAYKD